MLELKELSCGYSQKTVLNYVSETINPSELVFIVGPNGAGKTTFLATLAGVLTPVSGEMLYENQNHLSLSAQEGRPAYLPSEINISPELKTLDLIDIFEIEKSLWFNSKILETFNISHLLHSRLGHLSSGERQRVLLTMVLSHRSPFVLLDEPLSFLEWQYVFVLYKKIIRDTQKGRIFIISSHDFQWSLRFPLSKTWILYQNRLYLKGATPEILVDERFQKIFQIRSKIIDSPLNKSKILALAEYDSENQD